MITIILIAKIVFVLSLLGVLFIIIRKIPALTALPEESFVERFSFKVIIGFTTSALKGFTSSNLFKNTLIGKTEKFLRKFKILILKLDNALARFIKRIRKHSNNSENSSNNKTPS